MNPIPVADALKALRMLKEACDKATPGPWHRDNRYAEITSERGPSELFLNIEKLSAAGLAYKHVAKVAGMSPTTLWSYKTGKRTKLRAHHAKRILAIKAGQVAAGSRVPSGPTLDRVRWLREEGFTNIALARLMGLKGSGLQFIKSPTITRRTADRLERIYREHHDAKLGPERPEAAEAVAA